MQANGSKRQRRTAHTRNLNRLRTLQLEALEHRRLLTATIQPVADVFPFDVTAVGSEVYFESSGFENDDSPPFYGLELWKSDGTLSGTALVKDINTKPNHYGNGTLDSYPSHLTNVGGTLFFVANDGTHGYELWTSDGTSTGTTMVLDINPGSGSSIGSSDELLNVAGTLYFTANDGTHGGELWKSDGTASGTVLLQDFTGETDGGGTGYLTNVNGTLYFAVYDSLWTSDGTASGTSMVYDFGVSPGAYLPRDLTNVGGTLFFSVIGENDSLWQSDGTSTGTTLVYGPAFLFDPRLLTNVGGDLFFSASDDNTQGTELWKSDGTSSGTMNVDDINPGPDDSSPQYLTNVGGTLFFAANDGSDGTELWKSNGTASGTVMVDDINPGSNSSGYAYSSNPKNLLNVSGTLFFQASDGSDGAELWTTDGTSSGTSMVEDLEPTAGFGSVPEQLTNLNGVLIFSANVDNQELWALDVSADQAAIVNQPPADVQVNTPFAVTVDVLDAAGNLSTSYSGPLTVTLVDNNQLPEPLGGTTTVNAVHGVAVFSDLSIATTTGNAKELATDSLQFGTGGIVPATSTPFVVTGTTQLSIVSQPGNSHVGENIAPVTIEALDSQGSIDPTYDGAVTVSLASNPGSATLHGSTTVDAVDGVAVFSNLVLDQPGNGYTLQFSAAGLPAVTTNAFTVFPSPKLVITGTSDSNDNVSITFTSPTQFTVTSDGQTITYSTNITTQVVYNAPSDGTFSQVVFDDPDHTYTATQTLNSTTISSDEFSFTATGASILYIYAASGSSASVSVADGGSTSSNFLVVDGTTGSSYLADPATGQYSELSGFGTLTASGSGGTTYAYIYSTPNASTSASPVNTIFNGGGISASLDDFPQVYIVGAVDGSDTVTLASDGGELVGTPQFTYATSTSTQPFFLLGALYSSKVTGTAAGADDTAAFYSYPANAFVGSDGRSTLTGATANVKAQPWNFSVAAANYRSVTVYESGLGTDTAAVTAATFTSTPTSSSVTVGNSTIVIDTFFASKDQGFLPIANQISVTAASSFGASAVLVDSSGANALVAGGPTATLTAGTRSVTVSGFDTVEAEQQSGSDDTIHETSVIDFALSTTGNWTSV